MNALSIAILVFIAMETTNIIILYFIPSSQLGNGTGVFNAFEESKKYPEIHALVRYLINWVAGTKLIFIALLIVILVTGNEETRMYTVGALILSISSFFWRLYPAIRSMDKRGQITPAGYSKGLFIMIAVFIAGFAAALGIYLVGNL